MDGTLGRPCLQGNPSSMASVVSESSEAHLPYILLYDPQYPPTDLAIVDCLKKNIHGVEMNKFLDFGLLDPQRLPNARDDGGIYCLIKLSKLKEGGKNFNRKTEEGRWVISQKDIPVMGNNEGHIRQLGIKTPLHYRCKDKEQSDQWLMKQYKLHQRQWPLGKEEEWEKLALCHIYRKHNSRNGSSSSITSGAEPSQNYPVLDYPQELQSSSILGSGRIGADSCSPNSKDSNPYDHSSILCWDASSESRFWNQTFTNQP